MKAKKSKNNLTKKEQSTTTAYKMMSEKINNLESSLKKTQDESEKIRTEKYEIEKENILLKEKLKDSWFISVLEFISSASLGFGLSYLTTHNTQIALSISIPSIIVYIVCVYLTKK